MDDVALGMVHGSTWDAYFGLSLIRVARDIPELDKWIAIPSGPTIDIGRNSIVESFLASGKEWLFMVDTDMTFSPGMLRSMYEKRNPEWVLSGLCMANGRTWVPKVEAVDENGNPGFRLMEPNPEKPLVEVAMTGAAFTIAHRTVYEKVAADYGHTSRPWYAFTERYPKTGEDAEFCARAREAGFKIVIDCTVRPGHRKVQCLGNYSIPE